MEGYIAYMDAAVLQAINDGARIWQGESPIGHKDSKGFRHGGGKWASFFALETERMRHNPSVPQSSLDRDRLDAEQVGVDYARSLDVSQHRLENETRKTQIRIDFFLLGADTYRAWCPCGRVNPRQGWPTLRKLAVLGEIYAAYGESQFSRSDYPFAYPLEYW